jgi:UDP-N-acetylglucosamine acyltransferase
MMIDGSSGCVVGLNLVGLRRNGFGAEQVAELNRAYRVIYRRGHKWTDVLEALRSEFATGPAAVLYEFLSGGTRGFVQERRMPPGATIKLRAQADDSIETGESQLAVPTELRAKAG